MSQSFPIQHEPVAFDPRRRFVRVTGISSRGFVEFEFSIGSPELCVELVLPPAAFEEFCAAQAPQRLDAEPRDRCAAPDETATATHDEDTPTEERSKR